LGTDTDTIVDDIESKMQVKKLYEALSRVLKDREKTVIIMRFGLAGTRCKTQREVAKELNISRSYVSRIEKKAIQKLKKIFVDEYHYA
jgi:RNA polymerase sporulation-specific sigma factor